jgi:hypothetical protein
MSKKMFRFCEKCGKPLIERLPNGIWILVYGGKRSNLKEIESEESPIVMKIHGSIKMRCFRKECRKKYPDHWNILNYFPDGALFHLHENQPVREENMNRQDRDFRQNNNKK